jgi:hypothetical protein
VINAVILLSLIPVLIINNIIDYKHLHKHKRYQPGNEVSYYWKLMKQGDRDGKLMIATNVYAVVCIILLLISLIVNLT